MARKSRRLTSDEVRRLVLAAQAGDTKARNELVEANLGLVWTIARGVFKSRSGCMPVGYELLDLVQAGTLGLMRAIEMFDPSLLYRLSTYAAPWIYSYVSRVFRDQSIVRGKGSVRYARVVHADISLDAPVSDAEEAGSRVEAMPTGEDDPSVFAERIATIDHVRKTVHSIRGKLGKRGLDLIESRLASDDPETLEMIGKRWGCSRENVRQVEMKTLRILRERFEAADAA